jgi:hypothetical protein
MASRFLAKSLFVMLAAFVTVFPLFLRIAAKSRRRPRYISFGRSSPDTLRFRGATGPPSKKSRLLSVTLACRPFSDVQHHGRRCATQFRLQVEFFNVG